MARSVRRPLFARVFIRLRPVMDRQGAVVHRRRLLAGLSGRVPELGAGDGGNFAYYPPEVTGVVAVEPEPYLRAEATRRATAAPVPIEVVDGVADRLPVDDGAVDAVVVSLVLCSVPDQAAALAELRRVLRPGGELRFFEHVAADTRGLRRAQAVADRTLWPLLCGGCHTGRTPSRPSARPASRSRRSTGSGSRRAGHRRRPHRTRWVAPAGRDGDHRAGAAGPPDRHRRRPGRLSGGARRRGRARVPHRAAVDPGRQRAGAAALRKPRLHPVRAGRRRWTTS